MVFLQLLITGCARCPGRASYHWEVSTVLSVWATKAETESNHGKRGCQSQHKGPGNTDSAVLSPAILNSEIHFFVPFENKFDFLLPLSILNNQMKKKILLKQESVIFIHYT